MCEIPPPYNHQEELDRLESLRRRTTSTSVQINWAREYRCTLWQTVQLGTLWVLSLILVLILFWLFEALRTADILCDTIPDQDKPAIFQRTTVPCPTCPAYERVELDPAELEDQFDTTDFL